MGFNGRDRRRQAITLPPAQTRGIMSTAIADCFRETPTQTHRSAPIREGERLRESERKRERERERKDRKTERERERESEKERQPARPWVHKVVLESYVEGSTGRNDGEKEQNLASFRHTLDGVSATQPTRSRVLSGASLFRTVTHIPWLLGPNTQPNLLTLSLGSVFRFFMKWIRIFGSYRTRVS